MARYTATLGRPPPLDFRAETFGFDASGPVLSESMVVAEVGFISNELHSNSTVILAPKINELAFQLSSVPE